MKKDKLKIGALIPIRLGSERLPKKALLPLRNGTVLECLLKRVKLSKYLKNGPIIICTTNESSDDDLVVAAKKYGVEIFRGSTDDIIDRFYNACIFFKLDAVIQIDGDDPCADYMYMDLCMDKLIEDDKLGIVSCEGLPLGLATKAFSFKALEKVWKSKLDDKNDTGFSLYFTKSNLFPKATIKPVSPKHIHEKARLTLDYPEDLEFFEKLLAIAEPNDNVAGIEKIVEILNAHEEIVKINAFLNDEYWKRSRTLGVLHIKDGEEIKNVEF
jgi:spore coat polysaccharide biosynthesis protein SpsF